MNEKKFEKEIKQLANDLVKTGVMQNYIILKNKGKIQGLIIEMKIFIWLIEAKKSFAIRPIPITIRRNFRDQGGMGPDSK